MKVITAIEDYVVKPDDIKVFMAGGITKCRDWQKEMIDILNQYSLYMEGIIVIKVVPVYLNSIYNEL